MQQWVVVLSLESDLCMVLELNKIAAYHWAVNWSIIGESVEFAVHDDISQYDSALQRKCLCADFEFQSSVDFEGVVHLDLIVYRMDLKRMKLKAGMINYGVSSNKYPTKWKMVPFKCSKWIGKKIKIGFRRDTNHIFSWWWELTTIRNHLFQLSALIRHESIDINRKRDSIHTGVID